ncbi:MAG: energy-coupling factor transporter transmembrane component T [Gemmataceae bacterium]|nr:energy-coupling factor transporter transmembrane protein EcfT [Gemmata sp.]MDW8196474.1 energy-coupling factor transporter transmembrane component T [Gemmataceae bacterium]
MRPPALRASRTPIAVMKVLYLLAVTVVVFCQTAVEESLTAWIVGGLFALQVVILLGCGVPRRELVRPLARLKWFFVILFGVYAFVPGDEEEIPARWQAVFIIGQWVWINRTGIAHAGFISLQILTVIFAAAVVRRIGPPTDFVVGLQALGLPKLFVYSLHLILAQLTGPGPTPRAGRGHESAMDNSPGFFTIWRQLIRGDVTLLTLAIHAAFANAQRQLETEMPEPLDPRRSHDVVVIAGIGGMMIGLKMLKLLPGVPIASGHKTLLLFPLYLLAARLTSTRWGGTTAGAVMGVVAFLQGDGRFGIFEVLKHLAPGCLIDLLMPVVRRLPTRAWVYCGVGLLAGFARLAAEIVVLLLLGTRAEVYLFWSVKLLPTLAAGLLSGFVTLAVVRAFPTGRLPEADNRDNKALSPTQKPLLIGPSQEKP